jgi:hypothetical protein
MALGEELRALTQQCTCLSPTSPWRGGTQASWSGLAIDPQRKLLGVAMGYHVDTTVVRQHIQHCCHRLLLEMRQA